jgi:hypothetical protein
MLFISGYTPGPAPIRRAKPIASLRQCQFANSTGAELIARTMVFRFATTVANGTDERRTLSALGGRGQRLGRVLEARKTAHGDEARALLAQPARLDDEIAHDRAVPCRFPRPASRASGGISQLLGANVRAVKWPSCRTPPCAISRSNFAHTATTDGSHPGP